LDFMNKHGFWFLLIALGVVGFAFYSLKQQSSSFKPALKPVNIIYPKLPGEVTIFPADPQLGERQAPVKIIEFGDFQCPFCAQTAPILEQTVKNNKGKVELIWKDFPLPDHPEAYAAAAAAQCAGRQGKFWEYHDQLFLNQSSLGQDLYNRIASSLNLNMEKFSSCLSNHEAVPLIKQNIDEARAIGVDSTPYFVINGQVYSGIISQEELNSLINSVSK